jgi:hypothetical protein
MDTGRTPTLVGLPVDGRPVVRSQVAELVACGGATLLLPEVAALGHLRRPADRDALWYWLVQHGPQADGFVVSLDMLLYGGLVPSRFVPDALAELAPRLLRLRELKARWPDKPLYAFAATMRISNNNVAEEEKPYWAEHGTALWLWSFHSDRAAHSGCAHSQQQAQAAAARVPDAVRQDWLATRQRNHTLVQQALDLVAQGVIDRLALPQDDTAAFGFNIAERRALQARVQTLGLDDRVHLCPGADEVLHTLCAHQLARLRDEPPLKVALAPSDPAQLPALHALYEDRPLLESVRDQIAAVGAVAVAADEDADLLLALHTQGPAQGDWAMGKPLPQRPGVADQWLERLHGFAASGHPVALVDCAFANGGDPWLMHQTLPRLFTYAAWNTASNRLGGALAHGALAIGPGRDPFAHASQRVLALRWLEDGLYQAVLRAALRGCAGGAEAEAALTPGQLLRWARELVLPACQQWAQARGLPVRVVGLNLPWDRSFEIELLLEDAVAAP